MNEAASYPLLRGLRVSDAMHHGLVSCPVGAPLLSVARMMATHRVHAILVISHGEHELPGGRLWGVILDRELLRAAQNGDLEAQTADSVAGTPPASVRSTDDLGVAAGMLTDPGTTHVIVLDPRSERPIGVLSRLDIVRALAGFPERHPGRT